MTTKSSADRAAGVARWVAAHLGWHVLPLHPDTKRPLAGCPDCRGGGGHTAAQCACLARGAGALCHGVWAASSDPAVVARWAGRWRTSVWAVHLGVSGLLCVDLDAHGGTPPAQPLNGVPWPAGDPLPVDGIDTYATLAGLRGAAVATTLATDTPSGGLHLLYAAQPGRWKSSTGRVRDGDDTVRTGLGWQIDIKAYGGYVILPGSTTAAGTYQRASTTVTPAPLPGWLAAELIRTGHDKHATPTASAAPPVTITAHDDQREARYAAGALRSACAELAEMPADSGRNRKLFRSTSRLAGMVAAGWIDRAQVETALTEAAGHAALPAGEIRYAIASGFRHPRPAPEHRSTT
ncbi:bifunctional DNA primase/polymerase [Saccharothrix deserti]|uniref:bifunctional DNA primase/polymerase n=1 Tax=Saccharothrix deserti TaxID=2593674 RepID=UPI00131B8057|nr:bifunctional DNA primase/polymerase [Saccharothrix deserti]